MQGGENACTAGRLDRGISARRAYLLHGGVPGACHALITCGLWLQNPMDEAILERLQRIRAAFKVVTSQLRLKGLVFDAARIEAARNMAF